MQRTCKGSKCLGELERLIDRLEVTSSTRSGRLIRAVTTAISLNEEQLLRHANGLKQFKKDIPEDAQYPTALQFLINDEEAERDLVELEDKLIKTFSLAKLQTRWEMELLFYIYLRSLEEAAMSGAGMPAEESEAEEEISGPEAVKILVEMLLLRRAQDIPIIKNIINTLADWRKEMKINGYKAI